MSLVYRYFVQLRQFERLFPRINFLLQEFDVASIAFVAKTGVTEFVQEAVDAVGIHLFGIRNLAMLWGPTM